MTPDEVSKELARLIAERMEHQKKAKELTEEIDLLTYSRNRASKVAEFAQSEINRLFGIPPHVATGEQKGTN